MPHFLSKHLGRFQFYTLLYRIKKVTEYLADNSYRRKDRVLISASDGNAEVTRVNDVKRC